MLWLMGNPPGWRPSRVKRTVESFDRGREHQASVLRQVRT